VTFHGARPVDPALRNRYRDSTMHDVFYILRQRLQEPGIVFESRGSDVYLNQPVEIVDIVDSELRVVTVYFHQTTKLPVRQVFYRRDPQTKERHEESTQYSKYREIKGIQWPMAIHRDRDGEKVYEMFSDSVEIDKGLTDNLFTLPETVKKLKPAD
jgi:hypothetical protein